jgi:hypothetical protein
MAVVDTLLILLAVLGSSLFHFRRLDDLAGALRVISFQVKKDSDMNQEILDLLKKIDDETDAVAKEVADLKASIGTGMSPADVQVVHDRLAAISDRLEGIAADPANPVPPAPAPVV